MQYQYNENSESNATGLTKYIKNGKLKLPDQIKFQVKTGPKTANAEKIFMCMNYKLQIIAYSNKPAANFRSSYMQPFYE